MYRQNTHEEGTREDINHRIIIKELLDQGMLKVGRVRADKIDEVTESLREVVQFMEENAAKKRVNLTHVQSKFDSPLIGGRGLPVRLQAGGISDSPIIRGRSLPACFQTGLGSMDVDSPLMGGRSLPSRLQAGGGNTMSVDSPVIRGRSLSSRLQAGLATPGLSAFTTDFSSPYLSKRSLGLRRNSSGNNMDQLPSFLTTELL